MKRTTTDVAALLVFVQGGLAVVMVAEVTVALAVMSPALGVVWLLTAGLAGLLLWQSAGIRLRSSTARRLTIVVEALLLVWVLADLALALVLAGRLLEPMATLTRIVLPVAVIALLRRAVVRDEFRPESVETTVTP